MPVTFKVPYLYPKQKAFVFNKERFAIIEASTKSGKTVGLIVWIITEALQGKAGQNCWWVAPIYSQTEIAYKRMKRYITDKRMYICNESKLTITFRNGVTIFFKSADNPDSLYGEDVIACVMDEATRCKEEAYHAIRTTLTATGGKLKLIGNVKGNNNWVFKLARRVQAKELPNWDYFKLTAHDAIEGGVFSKQELEDARTTLPEQVFNELYMAEAFDDRGKPFIWAFEPEKSVIPHYSFVLDLKLPIYLSFDFNVDPITCTAHQHSLDKSWCRTFMEFELPNSDIYELCAKIKATFPAKETYFIINGDASGKNRSAMVKGNLNYFKIIQKELMIPIHNIHVASVNPSVSNSRLLTNALFSKHTDFKVTDNCVKTINDLKYCQVNDEGGIMKNANSVYGGAHLLDSVRYYHWMNFHDFISKDYYE